MLLYLRKCCPAYNRSLKLAQLVCRKTACLLKKGITFILHFQVTQLPQHMLWGYISQNTICSWEDDFCIPNDNWPPLTDLRFQTYCRPSDKLWHPKKCGISKYLYNCSQVPSNCLVGLRPRNQWNKTEHCYSRLPTDAQNRTAVPILQ